MNQYKNLDRQYYVHTHVQVGPLSEYLHIFTDSEADDVYEIVYQICTVPVVKFKGVKSTMFSIILGHFVVTKPLQ